MKRLEENKKVTDLTGIRYGKLLVLKFVEVIRTKSSSVSVWECICDCGNLVQVKQTYLKNTKIKTEKSCGCVRVKRVRSLLWGEGINDVNLPTQKEVKTPEGKREVVWRCPFYQTWMSMLRRCYSSIFHEREPSYKDCSVCNEWKYFSNFKSWMEKQDWKGKQLDKDLVKEGNKEYSPVFCNFVSASVNLFLTNSRSNRGDLPIGVHYDVDKKKYIAQCQNPKTGKQELLGAFDNPLDAHKKWKENKKVGAEYLCSLSENANIKDLLIRRYTFKEDEVCQY